MSEHRRIRELAANALDFTPATGERRQLAAHLRDCVDCRRFATNLRADQELARTLPSLHAPERVRAAVVAATYRPAPRFGVAHLLPAVGAAVIVLAVLAGLGWLNRTRMEGPGQLAPRTWLGLGDVPALSGGMIIDVVDSGGQLVAVGGIPDPARKGPFGDPVWGSAAVWTSADGASWQRLANDPSFTEAGAVNVAVNGSTLLVLGMQPGSLADSLGVRVWDAHAAPPTFRAWLADARQICAGCLPPSSGSPWQPVDIVAPEGGGTHAFFAAITTGGPGFVLVGGLYATSAGTTSGVVTPIGAVVATSADGSTWTFTDATSPDLAGGSMQGVAAGPSGLVAVGDTGLKPTVWTSVDGQTWVRNLESIASPGASMRSIAAGPDGFVAVGDSGGSARSWVSTDGRAWQAAPVSATLANARMIHVTRLGSEFVATGQSQDGTGVAWHSPDGRTWSRLDIASVFAGGPVQAAGEVGSRQLLFGIDPSNRLAIAVGDAP
jgi:predicted anti-sigma-YlaC factor YlaD